MEKKILVIGGTRFFGIPMVNKLLEDGRDVTLATRGMAEDRFGGRVQRIKLNVYDRQSVRDALAGKSYDVVIDKMGYGSADVRNILESVECGKFIHMSTAGVYRLDHMNIKEGEFDGNGVALKWLGRGDGDYDELKRQAEAALCQKYCGVDWTAVRCPFVLGENDYTKRLLFYVERAMRGIPMNIDNLDAQICFANEREMGDFLAFLVDKDNVGSVNARAEGTASLNEILKYIESKTGCAARISRQGDDAPYNGTPSNSLCVDKAESLGYRFRNINEWLPGLLDYYIDFVRNESGLR